MNYNLRILYVICLLSVCGLRAWGATSLELLEQAIVALEAKHDYAELSFGEPLKKIVDDFPTSQEATTAKVLLSSYYLAGNLEDVDTEVASFSDSVISGSPGTWQCALALMNKMALLDFQGNTSEELQVALAALTRTDLSPPSNATDPTFVRIRTAMGGSSSASVLDAFRASACYIYIDQENFTTASAQAGAVSDTALRNDLQQAISDAGG